MALEFELAALAGLIGLSGFFSGLEVALVGTTQATVERLVKDNVKGAKALQKLKSNPGWMMSSVNLGNNLVNIGSASLATVVAIELFGENGLGIAVGIMTFLIIIFGEVTPKTYCNANATKVSLRCSGILMAFSYVFYPAVWVLEKITRGIIKITGSDYNPPALTKEEIGGIIEQGHRDEALNKHESTLVHGALNFNDTVVRSVMTPRTMMFALDSQMSLDNAADIIDKSGHSRIPIYNKNMDDIVGVLHVRDILKHLLEPEFQKRKLGEFVRNPIFVSQEKRMSSLLKEMQAKNTHMAIVVDEFGGVEGCVTMEDLIEEIVGEIYDETDPKKPIFEKIDENTIVTNGDMEIDIINEVFKTSISQGDDYSTLNGLLHDKLHDLPKEGNSLEIDSLVIKVEKTEKNRPTVIRIEKITKQE
ncbi:MAG: hemolysin family protein [Nitrosopumilus sp.]|nr:hemolysin family protein [Nitrosopumilus sp.]MDH3488566.1 hemolysin family protein [Nitrosopumilus sp.]